MSRSGYSDDDDYDQWSMIRWRGAVASAIRGKRGQSFLSEMLSALDAMPQKRLISNDLKTQEGEVCAIGAVGAVRGVDMSAIDPDDRDTVASLFGISPALASEIVYMNDEVVWKETPEHRWTRMRNWVASLVKNKVTA